FGTSAAAPLWAGFTALVNQQAVAAKKAPVGFLNSSLYTIGTSANYTSAFHDITVGDNSWVPGSPTNYLAVPGYDLCTGWGTPNGTNLINMLVVGPRPPGLAPWITSQPQSQTVKPGATVSFKVTAMGTPTLFYQWYFNATNAISGATGTNYSIAKVKT